MVAKAPPEPFEVRLDAAKNAGEHADAIPQLGRIGGMVDVGFDGGRVDADTLGVFNLALHGVRDDRGIDAHKGLRGEPLDVFLQGRERRNLLVGHAAELAQEDRVVHPVGQLAVAEFEARLDNGKAHHLLGRHPLGPGCVPGPAARRPAQILPGEFGDHWVGLQDGVDFLPLFPATGSGMLEAEDGLGIANQAHSGPFLAVVFCMYAVLFDWNNHTGTTAICQDQNALNPNKYKALRIAGQKLVNG